MASVVGSCVAPKGAHGPIPILSDPKRSEEVPALIRAVFFDLDKTLLDLDGAYRTATQQVLGPVAVAAGVSLDTLRAALESVWPSLWETVMAGGLSDNEIYPRWFQTAFEQAGPRIGHYDSRELAVHYHQCFDTGLKPFPDAVSTLDHLRQAHPTVRRAIVTNGMTARQRRRLERSGLAGYFSHVIISEEIGRRKPDAGIFEIATQCVGVCPTDGLMIGDDPVTDVAGAHAAGMRTAWINRNHTRWPSTLPVLPHAEFRALTDLLPLLTASSARERAGFGTLRGTGCAGTAVD